MNLLNDLENDLVLAFLVEKKHTEKIGSRDVKALIFEVKKILEPILLKNKSAKEKIKAKSSMSMASY